MDNSRSIEFQDIKKDSQQLDIVRKSFRVPVDPGDDIRIEIDDMLYPVVDISTHGVGIICTETTMLTVSKIYSDCRLKTPEAEVGHLEGKIIHFSNDSGKEWHHGIQWVGLDKADSDKISSIVAALKKELLMS